MKTTIERHQKLVIKARDEFTGKTTSTTSVEAHLLFAILEKLEEIRCVLIDVEDGVRVR